MTNAPPAPATVSAPGTADRFAFGENWTRFLEGVSDAHLDGATQAFATLAGRRDLRGVRMLDIGSGSGVHSLAAWRLGAEVRSFDYDPASVSATQALRARYAPEDARWQVVGQGSVLDAAFMASLGTFDLVYSWGVLHHTGAMWDAVTQAAGRVAPGGQLIIALYNDQGWISAYWSVVKRLYNASALGRRAMVLAHLPYLGARWMVRALTGRLSLERGMDLWHDYLDWLGGWPFEVASPAAVRERLERLGFVFERQQVVGRRQGCNEFVFRRAEPA